jgi:hypothetical protein
MSQSKKKLKPATAPGKPASKASLATVPPIEAPKPPVNLDVLRGRRVHLFALIGERQYLVMNLNREMAKAIQQLGELDQQIAAAEDQAL